MLTDLKARRRDLAGRLAANLEARERLREAESDEAGILREIGELGAREVEALAAWACSGQGEKPEPDALARSALHDRLVKAQLAAQTAKGASVSLDDEQRDLTSNLQDVNAIIDRHAIDQLEAEHRLAVADLSEFFVSNVQPRIAHIAGLRAALTAMAQEHQAAGRGDVAMALFQRGEAIGNIQPDIEINPLMADVLKAASDWRARLGELTGDAPSNVVKLGSAA